MKLNEILLIITLLYKHYNTVLTIETIKYDHGCHPTKDNVLNVHVVSHSHMDAGWIKTFEEYYQIYVKYIINTVIECLMENENRKFTFVETAYLNRWYKEQNDTIRSKIIDIVKKGQMQIVSGGWSMNDEAVTHYTAIIDQMTLGHRWLNRTFGISAHPTVGWQIDTFGHSREYASILSQMNFDGLFLGRIDHQDKNNRKSKREMEFVWHSDTNLGPSNDIFTSVLPNNYSPPPGFCYDSFCINTDIINEDAIQKANQFIDQINIQRKFYATNHTIITMGGDFQYTRAYRWYENLDKLISTVNSMNGSIHMIYSTPLCYLKSLNQLNRKSWTSKNDDFFPYADEPNNYWSGYFTSRPSLKYHTVYSNNILQISKQLTVFANIDPSLLRPLQEAIGIVQHHDAITGTSKQKVFNDYISMLNDGINKSRELISQSVYKLLLMQNIPIVCDETDQLLCKMNELLNSKSIKLIIYNPLAHETDHYIRLSVIQKNYLIINSKGEDLIIQSVPAHPGLGTLIKDNLLNYELIFMTKLPPLSLTTYIVMEKLRDPNYKTIHKEHNTMIGNDTTKESDTTIRNDTTIGNNKIKAIIDGNSGLLKEVVILASGKRIAVHQNFYAYETIGSLITNKKSSGAYALIHTEPKPRPIVGNATIEVTKGIIVEEVRQVFSPWLSQVIRIYNSSDYIEFDWILGPLPTDNGLDVITRFDTNLINNKKFYTDSNGRQTIERIRDYRETWNLLTDNVIGSNYYPVTSWIFIKDQSQNFQVSILTDRAQGGSSMLEGSMELMIHRRLFRDDGYGVEEALNEPGSDGRGLIIRGKHLLLINNINESMRKVKELNQQIIYKPSLMTVQNDSIVNRDFKGLKSVLPNNCHLLTLEKWDDERILLRLEHHYEINDTSMSDTIYVKLTNLFSPFNITEIKEMSLTAIEGIDDAKNRRFKWKSDFSSDTGICDDICQKNKLIDEENLSKFIVTLKPHEIRTFLIRVKYL